MYCTRYTDVKTEDILDLTCALHLQSPSPAVWRPPQRRSASGRGKADTLDCVCLPFVRLTVAVSCILLRLFVLQKDIRHLVFARDRLMPHHHCHVTSRPSQPLQLHPLFCQIPYLPQHCYPPCCLFRKNYIQQ